MSTSHYHIFLCNDRSASSCYIFCLSHYIHISLHCFFCLTLRPHNGAMFWICHIMPMMRCHIFSLSHYVAVLLPYFLLLLYVHIYHILYCFKHAIKGKYSTKVWKPQILYIWISIFWNLSRHFSFIICEYIIFLPFYSFII